MFVPTVVYERHQKYLDAFINEKLIISDYLQYITKFICDHNMSTLNNDDLDFFKNLLFDSFTARNIELVGSLLFTYYDRLIKNYKFASSQVIFLLSKLLSFLIKISDVYVKDMFVYLWQCNDKQIILNLFYSLNGENRLCFINWANDKPDIIKFIPKLKLYILFS